MYRLELKTLSTKKANLNDLIKIKEENTIAVEGFSSCPVCHISLSGITKLSEEFEEQDFQNSIKFIQNQIGLFNTYLKTAEGIHDKIDKHIAYYQNILNDNRLKLQLFKESLYDDVRLPSKEKIMEQIILKLKLLKVYSTYYKLML